MKVSLIQMNSQDDKSVNLKEAERLIRAAVAKERPDLVVLPENFTYLGEGRENIQASADSFPDGPSYKLMQNLAAELQVTLHAGSMIERDGNAHYNTTVVFDPTGKEIARYRKLHLFDVDTPNGLVYRESDAVCRGESVVTYQVGDVTVGCSICYDMRFPELFRALRDKGARVIVLPAAFTLQTGKDHWEPILRARAIETQTWFLASGQVLSHAGGRKWCWGHSMIIDPWGHITAQSSDQVGFVSGHLDFEYQDKIRMNLPVAQHHVL